MIDVDSKQLNKLRNVLRNIKDGVPKALVPAINRALASGQTTVKREIRKIYTIKAKDIPTKLHRARYASPEGSIRIEQGMLGAEKFYYRPIARGKRQRPLFVQIRKTGGGIVARGFVTSKGMPYQRRSTSPRLPIRKVIAIGAPIMAAQPTVGPAVNKTMGDTLAKRIDYEIERVLRQAGGSS